MSFKHAYVVMFWIHAYYACASFLTIPCYVYLFVSVCLTVCVCVRACVCARVNRAMSVKTIPSVWSNKCSSHFWAFSSPPLLNFVSIGSQIILMKSQGSHFPFGCLSTPHLCFVHPALSYGALWLGGLASWSGILFLKHQPIQISIYTFCMYAV